MNKDGLAKGKFYLTQLFFVPRLKYIFADIVISTSALKVIFNNFMPQLEELWMIPITVRQHGSKTVIYIDKPLPPTSMTTEDKTAIRIKRGSRLVLARSWDNDYNQRKKDKKTPPRNRPHFHLEV